MKMLIVDDNKSILKMLADYAINEGYTVDTATDGEIALKKFNASSYDIILLDVMMPKVDGFEVCRKIRETSMVPVIMITARGEDFEKIMGLDIGADDYIVKPFSAEEVMARVRALMRRVVKSKEEVEEKISSDDLELDLKYFIGRYKGEELQLTKKEFELLWKFMNNPNIVFSRDQLLDSIWGYDFFGDSRTVDTHVKRLRQKLDKLEGLEWSIETIWGVGYKWAKK